MAGDQCTRDAPSRVAGQAIIEGVMMRANDVVAMAVRRKNKDILCEQRRYVPLAQRRTIFGWPCIRGFVHVAESLALGLKALTFSADIAAQDEAGPSENAPKEKWTDRVVSVVAVLTACALALLLFLYLPLLITQWIKRDQNPLLFNTIAGAVRIAMFLAYLWFISLWKEIRRVFEYHGAEHKAVFLFEAGKPLTIQNSQQYTTLHPRCGTSFLLIVAFVCIGLFALVDGLVAVVYGPYPNVAARFLVHVCLIPVVSGCAYEILRLSEKSNHWIIAALRRPGLWLQRITTREPDASQLEVAFVALEAATGPRMSERNDRIAET